MKWFIWGQRELQNDKQEMYDHFKNYEQNPWTAFLSRS